MNLLSRGNDALVTNPPVGVDQALSQNGSDWLWAVTAVFLLSFVSNLFHTKQFHILKSKIHGFRRPDELMAFLRF